MAEFRSGLTVLIVDVKVTRHFESTEWMASLSRLKQGFAATYLRNSKAVFSLAREY